MFQLGMTGKFLLPNSQERIAAATPKHTRLILSFRDGTEVLFVDPRRFGRVWCLRDLDPEAPDATMEAAGLTPLGPEALEMNPRPSPPCSGQTGPSRRYCWIRAGSRDWGTFTPTNRSGRPASIRPGPAPLSPPPRPPPCCARSRSFCAARSARRHDLQRLSQRTRRDGPVSGSAESLRTSGRALPALRHNDPIPPRRRPRHPHLPALPSVGCVSRTIPPSAQDGA